VVKGVKSTSVDREDSVGDKIEQQPPTGERLKLILERAKAEWEAAFDSISEGIAIVEPDGTVRRVNAALATLLGRDIRSMVGLRCCELFAHHRVDDKACPVINYPHGKQGAFEIFFPDYRYYEDSFHPIMRAGRAQGYVITVRDVTREQMANQERKHVYLQMEEAARKRKLAEDALEDIRAELVRAEKTATLGSLAAMVFSEINRAIRTLHDGLEILADKCCEAEESVTDDCRSIVSELLATAGRSSRILDKLAQLRVEDADSIDELDVNRIVEEVLDESRETADRFRVELLFSPGKPGPVEGNRDQLFAVISSLVLNAIDAATKMGGGTVTISTGLERQFARIEVADKGKGIEAAHLPQVFNPFFTTDPQSSKIGLGLTICQAIVQGHHGHVVVDSEPDKGTTVKILLPLAG